MQGILGKKIGMTQVFDEDGQCTNVTVIKAGPCVVVQRKTKDKDGYDAIQLGFDDQKEQRVAKPALGRFKKAGVTPKRFLKEFAADGADELKEGDEVNASIFEGISHVDIIGTSKGKGFQGVVHRYRFGGGRMTHGGHNKRGPGAIGQCAYPSRVAKNRKMPGHMGNVQVTQQNLSLVKINEEDNVILVGGSVPGANGSLLVVKKALKKSSEGKKSK